MMLDKKETVIHRILVVFIDWTLQLHGGNSIHLHNLATYHSPNTAFVLRSGDHLGLDRNLIVVNEFTVFLNHSDDFG